ncbi:MAG: anthranilate synthase component I family protein [Planctomycetota bacterium]
MKIRPRVFPLERALDTGELLSRLRDRRGLAALDSASGWPRRTSLVAFDPLRDARASSWDELDLAFGLLEVDGEVPGPFAGGFLGALSYDLGVRGERAVVTARDPLDSPRIAGGVYGDFIVRDEDTGAAWLVLSEGLDDGRPDVETRRDSVLTDLAQARELRTPRPLGELVRHTTSAEHCRRIDVVRAEIAAGDYYQANLAHRFSRRVAAHPVDLYLRLRALNPAPYMGFVAWDAADSCGFGAGSGALLSASPELFFEFDGRLARTRPIKGTIARGATPQDDRAAAAALLASAKDTAELAMIVDLERNDLGRVAEPGGVWVEGFPTLRTYASVHHLTADVVARTKSGTTASEILAALFPGGSITGAPKLASMRAIAALEGEGRGFFSGALGFVDARGRAAFNILIRTIVWRAAPARASDGTPVGEASFHVGGGITWSSDARAEDRETWVKGRLLAETLAGEDSDERAGVPATRAHTR